jgi:hypothetical protein
MRKGVEASDTAEYIMAWTSTLFERYFASVNVT